MIFEEELKLYKSYFRIIERKKVSIIEHFTHFHEFHNNPFFMEEYEASLIFLNKSFDPIFYFNKYGLLKHIILDKMHVAILNSERLLIVNHKIRKIEKQFSFLNQGYNINGNSLTFISNSKLVLGTNDEMKGVCLIMNLFNLDQNSSSMREIYMGEHKIEYLAYSGSATNILLAFTNRMKIILYSLQRDTSSVIDAASTLCAPIPYGENQWIAYEKRYVKPLIHIYNYQEEEDPKLVLTRSISKAGKEAITSMCLIGGGLLAIGTNKGFLKIWNLNVYAGRSIANLKIAQRRFMAMPIVDIQRLTDEILAVKQKNMKVICIKERECKLKVGNYFYYSDKDQNIGPLVRLK